MTTTASTLRTILVATDGSPDAALATRIASDLAAHSGAALHLVHAWLPVAAATYPYPTMPTASAYKLYQTDAQAILDRAAQELTENGGTVAGLHLHCGQTAAAITALAEEVDADLIVLGSRGLGRLRRLILGSVSSIIAHEATRPLLIVRGGEQAWPPQRIVVGDDGTAAAQGPADLAATLGYLYGVPLTLVHACAPLPRDLIEGGEEMIRHTIGLGPLAEGRAEMLPEEIFHRATGLLNERAVRLGAQGGMQIEPAVVFGDPAAAIVEAAEVAAGPALIVVGSRGLGALARWRLGSVSTKVLHAATGPVLIVPQGPAVAP